jgi:hypothetical protein
LGRRCYDGRREHRLLFLRPAPNTATAYRQGDTPVSDTAFIILSVAFFVLAAAFAYFCDKVR